MQKIKLCLLLVVLLSVFSTHAFSKTIILDSEQLFEYANECYEKNDFISTVVELKKFISFFPNDSNIEKAKFLTGMAWYKGGNFGEAIKQFNSIIDNKEFTGLEKDANLTAAYFMLSRCHVSSGNPVMAEILLDNFIKITKNSNDKDRALNRIAWIRLETARWDKSRISFNSISQVNRKKFNVDEILLKLEDTDKISKKNPKISGTLAIIPGAGYLYCNRYQDAFVSFLLNGAVIYAAYESFERENHALGGLISFVGFGFYSGSIYGSVSSVHKYNRNARLQFIDKLKKETHSNIRLGILPDFKRKGAIFAFMYEF